MQRRRGCGGREEREKKGATIRSRAMREGLERLGGASPRRMALFMRSGPTIRRLVEKGQVFDFPKIARKLRKLLPSEFLFTRVINGPSLWEKYFVRKSSMQP